jgi:ribosomal protein S27E
MKCPKCDTTKLDFDTENQQRGIVLRVHCTQCEYEGSTFVEEDTIEED